jgi:hypothetical protein
MRLEKFSSHLVRYVLKPMRGVCVHRSEPVDGRSKLPVVKNQMVVIRKLVLVFRTMHDGAVLFR